MLGVGSTVHLHRGPWLLPCNDEVSVKKEKILQYLSGADLPLKTNYEMVRIFKKLNGSFNAKVKHFLGKHHLNSSVSLKANSLLNQHPVVTSESVM